ncbi:MAG TPA: prolyl oligopeptidase family serine peptidase [Terriglobia bacterium]|nr:prolyl oligopeptidase family serine peptidase [Terriglobia bacterium]
MPRFLSRLWLLPLLLAALVTPSAIRTQETKQLQPPKTRTDDVKEGIQGVEIADPYRWLEDQQSPETRAWINAQNKYTQTFLDTWPGRAALKQRLTELIRIETISMPVEQNGKYFFKRRAADQEQGVLYVRTGPEGKDETLVDPNPLSPDKNISVDLQDVSHDGTLVAYSLRHGGEDETAVRLLDVRTRAELPGQLPRRRYEGIGIKPDKSGLYYSWAAPEGPRLDYHAMRSDPAKDLEVFGKGYGPDKIIEFDLSEDGHYLTIMVHYGAAADRTEVYFQDLQKSGPIRPLINDIPARFIGAVGGDHAYLQTNWKAPKGRILKVDLANPGRENWREIVPESDAPIESFSLAGGRLFVKYTRNASSQVKVFDADGAHVRDIDLPMIGTINEISGRWTSKEAFYEFTSYPIPRRIYRYDIDTGNQSVWAETHVPIHGENFEVKQVWYTSKDKTRVPMFLMYRKGIKLEGNNPTLLTGYGGFNINITPYFSAGAALWADQGGVFAEPNLRGGGEFGEEWHRAGMLDKKQNVFDDFIAAAAWLINNHYTQPSKLAIEGASNGGLLVGAALTQRPDLFRAVVCAYPLLDMLRYQKFFVAKYWVPEYGSADDPAQFKYLYAYSPYQHVVPGRKYPAVLFVTGDGDTRVAPLHARKMTALLQADIASDRPVLLRYDTEAGHSAGVSVTKSIDQATDSLGFLFWQLHAPFSPDPQ